MRILAATPSPLCLPVARGAQVPLKDSETGRLWNPRIHKNGPVIDRFASLEAGRSAPL